MADARDSGAGVVAQAPVGREVVAGETGLAAAGRGVEPEIEPVRAAARATPQGLATTPRSRSPVYVRPSGPVAVTSRVPPAARYSSRGVG